jgi:hypothetical protein
MGALSSLNLASNAILSKESGRALADALKTNSVLTELDVSDNQDKSGSLDGAGFAKELAVGIKDNGALSKFTFSGDQSGWSDNSKNSKPVTVGLGMTKADFSGKVLGVSGAIILAAWITHKDNGALLSLNLSSNNLKAGGAEAIMKSIKVSNAV